MDKLENAFKWKIKSPYEDCKCRKEFNQAFRAFLENWLQIGEEDAFGIENNLGGQEAIYRDSQPFVLRPMQFFSLYYFPAKERSRVGKGG